MFKSKASQGFKVANCLAEMVLGSIGVVPVASVYPSVVRSMEAPSVRNPPVTQATLQTVLAEIWPQVTPISQPQFVSQITTTS